tara:strand:- start:431 stop:751 length:321 start_codon:yes stop_codon:yes gene_type:complete
MKDLLIVIGDTVINARHLVNIKKAYNQVTNKLFIILIFDSIVSDAAHGKDHQKNIEFKNNDEGREAMSIVLKRLFAAFENGHYVQQPGNEFSDYCDVTDPMIDKLH